VLLPQEHRNLMLLFSEELLFDLARQRGIEPRPSASETGALSIELLTQIGDGYGIRTRVNPKGPSVRQTAALPS
jgi:hypothetical protein